jgi:hypothetical protein
MVLSSILYANRGQYTHQRLQEYVIELLEVFGEAFSRWADHGTTYEENWDQGTVQVRLQTHSA